MKRSRLDTLLVDRGLCASREQARRSIQAGLVKVDDRVVDKPGTEVSPEAAIALQALPPYVSRGGQKLEKALQTFAIAVAGRICLDGGISTGGFTDCLLQAGAQRVYGVDVGYGQVAWKLRQDARVVLKERTNFRYLQPQALYGDAPFATLGVLDLSFISLTKVLDPLWQLLAPPREAILLVKPQFEVGRSRVGKKGVVRDRGARAEAIIQVAQAAEAIGWGICGLSESPLTGPAGNVEYLLWLRSDRRSAIADLDPVRAIATAAESGLTENI